MTLRYIIVLRCLFGALLVSCLAGCTSVPIEIPPGSEPLPLDSHITGYSSIQGERYGVAQVAVDSSYGCNVKIETFLPENVASDVAVILGHGFMRDLSSMRGWAELWASRGIPTIVLSFCNSTWINGYHARNAEDMIEVANRVEADYGIARFLYAGFSAGGLAALIASSRDERAVAYLGLDPVDSGKLAATVNRLSIPALFLFGIPSNCNSRNNMLGVIPKGDATLGLRIRYATHCDFENPHDPQCEGVCGYVKDREIGERVSVTIRSIASAWIVSHAAPVPDLRAEAKVLFDRASVSNLVSRRAIEVLFQLAEP